jgi:predicted SprT family Zn-dependent metalloprotease
MYSEKQIIELCDYYLKDLKTRYGRKFNPIKFEAMKRKNVTYSGIMYLTFAKEGYDRIVINPYLASIEYIINTILHELAHADLEARGNHHGDKWKRVARAYSSYYNTVISRVDENKQLVFPDGVCAIVTWSDKCIRLNPSFRYKRVQKKEFKSQAAAEKFQQKYMRLNFLDSFELKSMV